LNRGAEKFWGILEPPSECPPTEGVKPMRKATR